MTGVVVLIGVAAVIGLIVFGGSTWIYFKDERKPLPPKPTAAEREERWSGEEYRPAA